MVPMTAREIFEVTDWNHLIHAYGTGADDVAALGTLLGSDEEAMRRAVEVLDSAYLHQSTVFPATSPAVAFVLAVLSEWGTEAQEHPVAPDLLAWIEEVGWSLYPYLDDVRSRSFDHGAQDRIAAALDAEELDWEEQAEDLEQVLRNAALCLLELAPTAAKTLESLSSDQAHGIAQAGLRAAIPWVIIAKDENVAPVIVARLGQLPEDLPAEWRDNVMNDLRELKAQL